MSDPAHVCVGFPGLFVGCGAALDGVMRRNACERCVRAWTAKQNPGKPLVPGDGPHPPATEPRRDSTRMAPDESLPRRHGSVTLVGIFDAPAEYNARHFRHMVRLRCDCGRRWNRPRKVWTNPFKRPSACLSCAAVARYKRRASRAKGSAGKPPERPPVLRSDEEPMLSTGFEKLPSIVSE